MNQQEDEAYNEHSSNASEDRKLYGPFDITEVPGIKPYIDFGSIKLLPREGLNLRLEVSESNQQLVAVTLDYQGSVLQVQAFSAPKSGGLWQSVRTEIAQQLSAQSATVREVSGPLGVELHVSPAAAQSNTLAQQALFLGVDGPRWLLRGVVMGAAITDDAARDAMIQLFREVVVVRGELPMPPGQLLTLQIPPGLRTTEANE